MKFDKIFQLIVRHSQFQMYVMHSLQHVKSLNKIKLCSERMAVNFDLDLNILCDPANDDEGKISKDELLQYLIDVFTTSLYDNHDPHVQNSQIAEFLLFTFLKNHTNKSNE